jgi:hypothetical protein
MSQCVLSDLVPVLAWLLANICEHAPWALHVTVVMVLRGLDK